MPSNLRKRKGPSNSGELPSSGSNPKPDMNDSGHVALNRQEPTIAPTVFIFLIVGLLLALPPIFYFTQVMIPDPESTSTLSPFRIKGNILLNALGHTTSSGKGRIPFSPSPQTPSSDVHSKEKTQINVESIQGLKKTSKLEHEEESQAIKQKTNDASSASLISSTPSISIVSSMEELKVGKKEEEQRKLDEELGKFWEASSRYRKQAQNQKSGEYSLQGDGTVVEGSEKTDLEQDLLDDLPPADPDAKEGLTPEFWEAIKDQLSADDLTVVLNEMRLKE